MKVLSEGRLNWAQVCKSACGWCGSELKFYLDRGDKRVTFREGYTGVRIKYICPICGERNKTGGAEGEEGIPIDVSVNYRKLTKQEYEDEVVPLEDEVVEMSDEDKAWLTEYEYIHKRH